MHFSCNEQIIIAMCLKLTT